MNPQANQPSLWPPTPNQLYLHANRWASSNQLLSQSDFRCVQSQSKSLLIFVVAEGARSGSAMSRSLRTWEEALEAEKVFPNTAGFRRAEHTGPFKKNLLQTHAKKGFLRVEMLEGIICLLISLVLRAPVYLFDYKQANSKLWRWRLVKEPLGVTLVRSDRRGKCRVAAETRVQRRTSDARCTHRVQRGQGTGTSIDETTVRAAMKQIRGPDTNFCAVGRNCTTGCHPIKICSNFSNGYLLRRCESRVRMRILLSRPWRADC